MKKILSIILVAVMLCGMMASSVFALDIVLVSTDDHSDIKYKAPKWYREAHEFVTEEWLMSDSISKVVHSPGYYVQYYTFNGEREISRAEIATIIHRYDWNYETTYFGSHRDSTCPAFADVPDGKWMTPAVQWAAENGIVNDVGGDSFAPNRTITREEFATIMYRYTEFKNVECDTTADLSAYPDSGEVSAWAKDAMAWAVGEGLIYGKPGGLLAPQDTITRAEVALIVYRYNNNVLAHRDNKK